MVVLSTAPDAGPDISDDETTSHPAVRNVTMITLGKLSGAMESSLSLRTVFDAAQAIASMESADFGPGFAKQYNQCPRSRTLHINSSEFAPTFGGVCMLSRRYRIGDPVRRGG